jgi:hypothetical protein
MGEKRVAAMRLAGMCVALWLLVFLPTAEAQQGGRRSSTVTIDSDDIGGVVRGVKGPEAGVWVIAETRDLPTKFARIVVTDDQGRYLIPDLPKASYKVWVRGYGLIDSTPVQAVPGKLLNLTSVTARTPGSAAQIYPASYWLSLMQIPPKSAFPMEKEGIETQERFVDMVKGSIMLAQIGDRGTRELPETLGKFNSSVEAWEELIKTGQSPFGGSRLTQKDSARLYADWTDRIAGGEVPISPPRPQGVERNVVITEWDWASPRALVHDEISTDKRHPTVNANGPVYSVEQHSDDVMNILNPDFSVERVTVPVRDQNMPLGFGDRSKVPLIWGDELVRAGRASVHNPMMDQKGRLWITAQFRMGKDQPAYCSADSGHPSAKLFPIGRNRGGGAENGRMLEMYDPKTKKFSMIDTCFNTHHLQFAEDADNTIWFSGDGQVAGWLNTKVYDETGDAAKAQGWCPYILDTNGNGKVDAYVEPGDPVDPTKDKRVGGLNPYGLGISPVDKTVWMASLAYPGVIIHVIPGTNPPHTCLTEIYNPPVGGYRPKGVDVDNNGLVWVAFGTSGSIASFDRRKCKVLNGPTATGNHCPEGWTVYRTPGPALKGTDDVNGDYHYLDWVDRFDTLGLGKNVLMTNGSNSDSVVALLPDSKLMVVLRVPYPLGFHSRGVDGRIDDPNGGWKGKGMWSTYGTASPWNIEGGKGTFPKAVKFQMRPNPLAK